MSSRLKYKKIRLKQNWKLGHCVKRQYRSIENIKCHIFWGTFWKTRVIAALVHVVCPQGTVLTGTLLTDTLLLPAGTPLTTTTSSLQELLTKGNLWVPYILPNRGQNKDTICSLLLLVFCMNCSGPSPISSCSVSSTGWLVLALYHNLSPVTIFPSLCYKIVQGLSGTGRMFSWREFPTTGFQLSTKLQATVMRRGRRGAAANSKLIHTMIISIFYHS